ncbi:MAG: TldD/PmbA family protein [Clostridiales bacterium]|nr:TldD/PmbA family protein [Clostridiales bacterium]
MLNIDKLFKAAEKAGIDIFEARISTTSKLSLSTFNTERESFTVADDCVLKVRGTVGGKSGVFTSDRVDDEVIDTAIAALKDAAAYGNPLDEEFFVKGGAYEYEQVNTYNDKLAKVEAGEYISLAKRIAQKALDSDKHVENVSVEIEYECETEKLYNSRGLRLERSQNYAMIYASAKAANVNEVQSGSHYAILSSLDGFDENKFAATLVANAVEALGGGSIETGKYTVVYTPECAAVLLKTMCDGFSAFNVEQHVSLLEGKIGTKAFAENFSLSQTPIGSDVFCSPFDAEGVPQQNRVLVDKGVPTGYVYDLATAKRAGVKSTGNGRLVGGNVRPAVGFVTVHAGTLDLDGLFKAVGDGVYITDLGGVSTGIDGRSGNYSLQANGFIIKNGKKAVPVSLMTVAGNIVTDFKNLMAVANDSTLTYYGVKTPSVAIRGLSISGVKDN